MCGASYAMLAPRLDLFRRGAHLDPILQLAAVEDALPVKACALSDVSAASVISHLLKHPATSGADVTFQFEVAGSVSG